MNERGGVTVRETSGTPPDSWQPHIVALVCNWCSYAGADMAGTTRLQYPANVRTVRLPCTGRVSPLMILKALSHGADGVLVSGCHPGDCHYVQGNLVARRRFTVFRALMDFLGIDLRRLHFAWVSAAEGHKWATVVSEVTAKVREAGPLPSLAAPDGWAGVELPPIGGEGPPGLDEPQLEALRSHLRAAASEALAEGRVAAVVGFGSGTLTGQTTPVFLTVPADCDRLVWGTHCHNNLGAYLGPLLERHERVAVVAKSCDLGAICGLIREEQVRRDRVVLIGVQCPGVHDAGKPAAKCLACSGEPHAMCDLVVTPDGVDKGSPDAWPEPPDLPDGRDEQIAFLESLPAGERWAFWQRQFSRCLRCYACRAACPLCYCSPCIADKHRPQWVPTTIDGAGNGAWNMIRALHLAGRCSGCDECARACPADIRLDLINRKLALEVESRYGKAGLDPKEKPALIDFRMEDAEEFIL